MKKYKVTKGFYKMSEQKTYDINETIDLTDVESADLLSMGWIEKIEIKEPKKTKKDD